MAATAKPLVARIRLALRSLQDVALYDGQFNLLHRNGTGHVLLRLRDGYELKRHGLRTRLETLGRKVNLHRASMIGGC